MSVVRLLCCFPCLVVHPEALVSAKSGWMSIRTMAIVDVLIAPSISMSDFGTLIDSVQITKIIRAQQTYATAMEPS